MHLVHTYMNIHMCTHTHKWYNQMTLWTAVFLIKRKELICEQSELLPQGNGDLLVERLVSLVPLVQLWLPKSNEPLSLFGL